MKAFWLADVRKRDGGNFADGKPQRFVLVPEPEQMDAGMFQAIAQRLPQGERLSCLAHASLILGGAVEVWPESWKGEDDAV
jgi:hypothetical protein